jgi:3-dehydroquinate synthase
MKVAAGLSSQHTSEQRIRVRAGAASYEVVIGAGLLQRIGSEATRILGGPRCAVVADETGAALFAPPVLESLRVAQFEPTLVTLPAGENSKSLERLAIVCDALAAAGLDRSSFVVALGGGVIGDLAGFAAAIYHRGIPCVQVPTTLLAQVDSSIGGKTGVNTAAGKNLLGAVHQPALVIADVETLATLPSRELHQGAAEIIKHAIIADAALFDELTQLSDEGSRSPALAALIRRNVEIKGTIVERDDQDRSGERAILNFGHTIGHAIERTGEYRRFLHGEAISLGIAAACEISVRRAGFTETERAKVLAALDAFHLPTRLPPDLSREAIISAVSADKKFERGQVRFVVTPGLGTARLTSDVTMEDISRAVHSLQVPNP